MWVCFLFIQAEPDQQYLDDVLAPQFVYGSKSGELLLDKATRYMFGQEMSWSKHHENILPVEAEL